MDGPSKNDEAFVVQEPTLTTILREKEMVDFEKQSYFLENLKSGYDSFYKGCVEGNKNLPDWIDFGDNGFVDSFTNNYFLDLFFKCGEYRIETGEILTVGKAREMAKEDINPRPKLEYVGKDNSKVKFDFFAGKNGYNFNTSVVDVSGELKKEVLERFSEIPAIRWIDIIRETFIQQKKLIAVSRGVYEMTDEGLQNINVDEELIFFIKSLDLVFQDQIDNPYETEREVTLDKINDLLDGQNEGVYLTFYDKGRRGKVTFALRSSSDQTGGKKVNLSLLLDTEKISGRSETDRFVVSKTAIETMGLLDESGIKISDQVLNYISEGSLKSGCCSPEFSSRYGNGYAELTRLLSYCVRLQDRQEIINKLFSSFSESGWEKIKEKKDKLTGPSRMFFNMIDDLIDPNRKQQRSDFNYYKNVLSMRDGACEDIESYYEDALERGKYKRDDSFFYQETYESALSAITRREIVVNGVRLPRGFLCRVSEKGVEPLRPTMFCFSKDEAIDAYGKQYWKAYKNDLGVMGELIEENYKNQIF
jgi:hypothetical protein